MVTPLLLERSFPTPSLVALGMPVPGLTCTVTSLAKPIFTVVTVEPRWPDAMYLLIANAIALLSAPPVALTTDMRDSLPIERYWGTAMEAKTATIASKITSSMSVNPADDGFILLSFAGRFRA